MPKIAPGEVSDIIELTRKPLAAETAPEFFQAVRDSYEMLRKRLVGSRHATRTLGALERAMDQCTGLRQRRVLGFCSAPIFDKPAIPAGAIDAMPEFLWLFCLPFTVQFTLEQAARGVALPPELFEGGKVLRRTIQAGCFNDKALLSGFPTLLPHDDLSALGPRNLANFFLQAEFGGNSAYAPPARRLDPEIESGRVGTYYMVAAARLPVGERQLFKEGPFWPADDLAALVSAGFSKNGFAVEKVTSLEAMSVTESLLRCTKAGVGEMRAVLELAKCHYNIKEAVLLQSLDGMADLTGIDEDGDEYVLTLPLSYVEPWSAVRTMAEMASQAAGLRFKSASLAIPTSSMTH